MRRLLLFLISIMYTMNMCSQNGLVDRVPYAAGRFYPDNAETLRHDLSVMFASCAESKGEFKVRAVVCPHAGYVFSGITAAKAYASIPSDTKYSRIFIIGSSHTMAFDGASVYGLGDYITPLGRVKVDREIAKKLKENYGPFRFPEDSHKLEHSLEVQMPFIQYHFKDMPAIVPIVIGTDNLGTIKEIADALRPYFTADNLFVISSDFSHYPPYNEAKLVDSLTAESIISKDPERFLSTLRENASKEIDGLVTSMCGWTSGLTLLYLVSGSPDLVFKKIYYCNSGDSNYGAKNEVVGYNSLILIDQKSKASNQVNADKPGKDEVSFTREEKEQLFRIARNSISSFLNENRKYVVDSNTVPDGLKNKMGAFVTLKIDGNLRGCIGRFISEEPLYEVVNEMAAASAFDDTRFEPLSKEEYKKISIEISVLGPLRKISDISEIVPGKHGIYIKKDFRSGTMLPQVLTENHWTIEQFLGYTSRDKAGLGWDGWKSADLYIYEAVVLEENE